jgi:hypothetical protein
MNAMIEDPLPQCDELACNKCEGYRLELSAAKAQLQLLKAELSKTRCGFGPCRNALPVRSVDNGMRAFCSIDCCISDMREARDVEF